MSFIFSIILGYLIGSIPFALIIGKVFYKTDVREFGSGNLGGTNAGRVLGKQAGLAVMACDILKVVLAVGIASRFSNTCAIWCGVACCIGHCWPVFAGFKGGKAVSTMFGFLLGCWLFIFHMASYFFVPVFMFFIVLFIFKYVSLSSICASICSSLYITATLFSWQTDDLMICIATWIMTLLVIYRHSTNIKKISNGTENKITWLK